MREETKKEGTAMKEYDQIVTELYCIAEQLCILSMVATESQARDSFAPAADVMANSLFAVEHHIRRISEELGEFKGTRKSSGQTLP